MNKKNILYGILLFIITANGIDKKFSSPELSTLRKFAKKLILHKKNLLKKYFSPKQSEPPILQNNAPAKPKLFSERVTNIFLQHYYHHQMCFSEDDKLSFITLDIHKHHDLKNNIIFDCCMSDPSGIDDCSKRFPSLASLWGDLAKAQQERKVELDQYSTIKLIFYNGEYFEFRISYPQNRWTDLENKEIIYQ